MSPVERLRVSLLALPGVVEAKSRFGSRGNLAWRIGGREFAHLHSSSLLDLRLPRAAQARLHKDPRVRFRRHASVWLEFEFRTAQDVSDVLALARQAAAAAKRGDGK